MYEPNEKNILEFLIGEQIVEIKVKEKLYAGIGKTSREGIELRNWEEGEEYQYFTMEEIEKVKVYEIGEEIYMEENSKGLEKILKKGALVKYEMEEGHIFAGYAKLKGNTIYIRTNKEEKSVNFEFDKGSKDRVMVYKDQDN